MFGAFLLLFVVAISKTAIYMVGLYKSLIFVGSIKTNYPAQRAPSSPVFCIPKESNAPVVLESLLTPSLSASLFFIATSTL